MASPHSLFGQPCWRCPIAEVNLLATWVLAFRALRAAQGFCAPHGCPSHRFDRFEAARARTASLGGCPHHFDTCPTGTPPRRRDA